MSNFDDDYKFECYEEYVGDAENVKKSINLCPHCGAKLSFNHLPDYKNLLIQESARCLECGQENRRKISVLM